MSFTVEKEIFQRLPKACFGAVVAKGIDNSRSYPQVERLLEESIERAAELFGGKKVKEEEHILPYREAFRSLGINPNKYMCSIEALFTRIAKGKGMAHINPVVDLGNAVSLKYMLPMGAHDLSVQGEAISVRLSQPGDLFVPFGEDQAEAPEPGEVVYATGCRVRTRRWTWRQSEYGKIREDSSYVFFPIDGFTDVNREAVLQARDELLSLVEEIFGCKAIGGYVDIDSPTMTWNI